MMEFIKNTANKFEFLTIATRFTILIDALASVQTNSELADCWQANTSPHCSKTAWAIENRLAITLIRVVDSTHRPFDQNWSVDENECVSCGNPIATINRKKNEPADESKQSLAEKSIMSLLGLELMNQRPITDQANAEASFE